MTDLKDHAFTGELIISFNTAILYPLPGCVFDGLTVAFVFQLSSGAPRVIKFTTNFLKNFCTEIKTTLAKFPNADQRDQLEKMLKDGQNIEELSQHPIVIYLQTVPDVPPETQQAMDHQYVKFIHINAYPDLFKFDITFVDGNSSRFSMATSVVVYFLEALEGSCSKIRSLKPSV